MKQPIRFIVLAVAVVAIVFFLHQYFVLKQAHSTFDNYYAFRGCAELLSRTDTEGTCKTVSGQTIKIVKFNDKWYLDGDLPWGCLGSICFGI